MVAPGKPTNAQAHAYFAMQTAFATDGPCLSSAEI